MPLLGSPPKDEAAELDELRGLFGHSTDVPRGMLLKYQVSKANREKADNERKAKEERERLLQERAEEQHARIQALRIKTKDKDTEAVARHHANNRKQATQVKQAVKEWEQIRQLKQQQKVKKVQKAGSADFHNARVGEIEEKMLKDRRDKAQQEHAAFLAKERARNQAKRNALNQQASRMHGEVEAAKAAAAQKLNHMKTTQADAAREAKRQWKEQLARNEKERLDRAHANRKHAEDVRARARANMDAQKNRRMNAGSTMQRRNQSAINNTRQADLERKRNMRQQQYGRRFASSTEAAELQKSTFRKLYGLNGIVGGDAAVGEGEAATNGASDPRDAATPLQAQTEPAKGGGWGW